MTQTNSRKLRWLPWVLGLSVLINTGFVAGFIYHRHIMLPAPERLAAVQQNLQLSDAQREGLMKVQRDLREEARENMALTRTHHQELVALLRKDQIDLPALEKHLRATTEPQVGMQRDVILRLLAFRDTLNPAQKEIFNEKMERPGFLLHLAGFPGPLWHSHHCHPGDTQQPPPGAGPAVESSLP